MTKEKLKVQIKFRQHVLQQEATKDLFLLTRCAGQVVTAERLQRNLCTLMEMANRGTNIVSNLKTISLNKPTVTTMCQKHCDLDQDLDLIRFVSETHMPQPSLTAIESNEGSFFNVT